MMATAEQQSCEHEWEIIGQCSSTGPTWQQLHDHERCTKCGRHAHTTRVFMDGRFPKGAKLAGIQAQEREHCRTLRGLVKAD